MRRLSLFPVFTLGLFLILAVGSAAPPSQVFHSTVTDEMLLAASADTRNWLTYGKEYGHSRYAASRQIHVENVHTLTPRWVFQTGGPHGSFQANPIVVDGAMYLTTPHNHVIALDGRTGKELWRFAHRTRGRPAYCCGPSNRGVAVAYGRVYMATLDSRLVALDQKTGDVLWDVEVADPKAGYSLTLAPLVYKGMVVVGNSGAEYGVRGFVDAYDASNGNRAWRFWTVPETGWEGRWTPTTWEGETLNRDMDKEKSNLDKHRDSWQRGGGSTWMTPAVDPETDTLFIMVGNPFPTHDGEARPGDNLYTNSMVALDARTGTYRWHYQYVPHDVWGWDAVSPAVLFETTAEGRRVKAVGHAGKTGWFYIHDRATGRLIRKSRAFVRQENMFARPTREGVRILPGANGGANWSPVAYSPETEMAYVMALDQPMLYSTRPEPAKRILPERTGPQLRLGGAHVPIAGEPRWGTLTAIDVNTGGIAWQKKLPDPLIGGTLVTAGGVVFGGGDGTGHFYAFDARTGRELWRFQCGAGVNAPPISFEVDGEQFIAVAAGGNSHFGYRLGQALFVFGLPRKP